MAGPGPASYVGRFAPSPTGPLHFGSLLAAVASYLQSRVRGGRWLLRIEDIDPPREQAGSDLRILATLEAYGFEWDGPVAYQSRNTPRHVALVESLLARSCSYRCSCSRRQLADAPRGPLGTIYPGSCRGRSPRGETAVRVMVDSRPLRFTDRLQGLQEQNLERESGDFVIRRRDGLIAYHLAVVADDADQGVTEVVRGIDLMDSTPRQIHLQTLLSLPTPDYMHIPVIVNRQGQKLSKLTGAVELPREDPAKFLHAALTALAQKPPSQLAQSSLQDVWAWAVANWRPETMRGQREIGCEQDPLAEQQNGLS